MEWIQSYQTNPGVWSYPSRPFLTLPLGPKVTRLWEWEFEDDRRGPQLLLHRIHRERSPHQVSGLYWQQFHYKWNIVFFLTCLTLSPLRLFLERKEHDTSKNILWKLFLLWTIYHCLYMWACVNIPMSNSLPNYFNINIILVKILRQFYLKCHNSI